MIDRLNTVEFRLRLYQAILSFEDNSKADLEYYFILASRGHVIRGGNRDHELIFHNGNSELMYYRFSTSLNERDIEIHFSTTLPMEVLSCAANDHYPENKFSAACSGCICRKCGETGGGYND